MKIISVYSDIYEMPSAIRDCMEDSRRYDVCPFMFIEVSMIKSRYHPEFDSIQFNENDYWLVVCQDYDYDDCLTFIENPNLDPCYDLNIGGF